jgi:hypothetical protein
MQNDTPFKHFGVFLYMEACSGNVFTFVNDLLTSNSIFLSNFGKD